MRNYEQPDYNEESLIEDGLSPEEVEDLSWEIIGTPEDPHLAAGSEVVMPNGETYRVESIDFSGRGVIMHNVNDLTDGYDISFGDFIRAIMPSA